MFDKIIAEVKNAFSGLKYAPYKAFEPRRLAALGVGIVGLTVARGMKKKDEAKTTKKVLLTTGLYAFGIVSIAAYLAGVLNPVTLYNRNTYAHTINAGEVVGQQYPFLSNQAQGTYYSGPTMTPAVDCRSGTCIPATAARGQLPAYTQVGVGIQNFEAGRIVGQEDLDYSRGALGTAEFSAPKMVQPNIPDYYGVGNIKPSENANVYLRAIGEVDFN